MIRLVRIARLTGEWEPVEAALEKMVTLYKEHYPQVKDISFWGGVTGPLNELRHEILFDSLADEETWAAAVMKDPVYLESMDTLMGHLSDMRDELYRRLEPS